MGSIAQLVLGALACLPFVLLARAAGPRRELTIYAAALVLAALVYVGFAVAGGATLGWTLLEVGGLVLFSLAGLLALKGHVRALVLGWVFHPVWDMFLHTLPRAGFVPEWYVLACAGFDLFLAAYLVLFVRRKRPGA